METECSRDSAIATEAAAAANMLVEEQDRVWAMQAHRPMPSITGCVSCGGVHGGPEILRALYRSTLLGMVDTLAKDDRVRDGCNGGLPTTGMGGYVDLDGNRHHGRDIILNRDPSRDDNNEPAPYGPQCFLPGEGACTDVPMEAMDDRGGESTFVSMEVRRDIPHYLVPEGFKDDCHIALVNTAWSLLIDNVDLIRWADCMVRGGEPACLSRVIVKANVKMKIDDGSKGFLEFLQPCKRELCFEAAPPAKVIGIEICDEPGSCFFDETEAFCCMPRDIGDHLVNRMCAAIDLASWIAHEALHLCLVGEPGPGNCGKAYLVGNLVKWGLFQRYSAALASPCCAHFPDIYLQNWDRGEGLRQDCAERCR